MQLTRYRDGLLIAAGSLLIGYFLATIGLQDNLFALLTRSSYLRDWAGASLMTALVWLSVRGATHCLDHRYDWLDQPLRRISTQLLLGIALPVLASIALALLYFWLVVQQPITESTYPIYEFPISVLFIVGFNLLYLGMYLYRKATGQQPLTLLTTQALDPATVVAVRKTLIVNSGLRNIPVPTEDVAYAYIDEASVFLATLSGGKYLVNGSLEELARDLPSDRFFRANRQFIIHRLACSSYMHQAYGKLKVEVSPALPKDIIVSQQKAPEFKKWLEEGY